MKINRIISVIISLIFLFSFSSCSDVTDGAPSSNDSSTDTQSSCLPPPSQPVVLDTIDEAAAFIMCDDLVNQYPDELKVGYVGSGESKEQYFDTMGYRDYMAMNADFRRDGYLLVPKVNSTDFTITTLSIAPKECEMFTNITYTLEDENGHNFYVTVNLLNIETEMECKTLADYIEAAGREEYSELFRDPSKYKNVQLGDGSSVNAHYGWRLQHDMLAIRWMIDEMHFVSVAGARGASYDEVSEFLGLLTFEKHWLSQEETQSQY